MLSLSEKVLYCFICSNLPISCNKPINFANSMFSLSKFKFSDIIPDISETLLICSIFKAIFLSSEL